MLPTGDHQQLNPHADLPFPVERDAFVISLLTVWKSLFSIFNFERRRQNRILAIPFEIHTFIEIIFQLPPAVWSPAGRNMTKQLFLIDLLLIFKFLLEKYIPKITK